MLFRRKNITAIQISLTRRTATQLATSRALRDGNKRNAGRRRNLNVVCRALRSLNAHGVSSVYPAHEWIFQETPTTVRLSRCGSLSTISAECMIAAHDARNGAWRDGSHLVGRRVDQRGERAVKHAADTVHARKDAATGYTAIQIDRGTWREGNEYAAPLGTFYSFRDRFNYGFRPRNCKSTDDYPCNRCRGWL